MMPYRPKKFTRGCLNHNTNQHKLFFFYLEGVPRDYHQKEGTHLLEKPEQSKLSRNCRILCHVERVAERGSHAVSEGMFSSLKGIIRWFIRDMTVF